MGVANAPDGTDRHLLANHYGPYLLTRLLLPAMHPGSRIVNVSSRAHYYGRLSIADGRVLDGSGGGDGSAASSSGRGADNSAAGGASGSGSVAGMASGCGDGGLGAWWQGPLWFRQYARSKLCNVLFTQQLKERLRDRNIQSFSVSPGFVNTSIFNNVPAAVAPLLRPLAAWLGRTPAQGAATGIFAAVSRELDGSDALFLHDCKPKEASTLARDAALALRLWDASEAFVGLSGVKDQSWV